MLVIGGARLGKSKEICEIVPFFPKNVFDGKTWMC